MSMLRNLSHTRDLNLLASVEWMGGSYHLPSLNMSIKQVSNFADDAVLEERILAHNPVPENAKALKAPEVDT